MSAADFTSLSLKKLCCYIFRTTHNTQPDLLLFCAGLQVPIVVLFLKSSSGTTTSVGRLQEGETRNKK
jgi:hypothetical protein